MSSLPMDIAPSPVDIQQLLADGDSLLAKNPSEAVAYARRAVDHALATADKLSLARAHLLYGMALRRLGDLVSSQSVLATAEELFRELGETLYLAKVWQARAAIHNAAGELDAAIAYLSKALPFAAQHDDKKTAHRILTTWALASMRRGDYATAMDRLREAEATLDELNDEAARAVVLNAFGSLYQRTRNFEASLDYFHRSLTLCRELRAKGRSESRNHAAALICISDTLLQTGRTDEAAPYLDEALEIARENDLLDVQASVLKAYGDRAMNDRHFDSAIRHYSEARDVLDATGNGMIMITVLNQLGEAQMHSGDVHAAETSLKNALDLEHRIKAPEHALRTHKTLAELYESRGEFERSSHHYKLALANHERLFSETNQNALAS